MRKQIDLTTLPGWANLSSGNHTIKIKAKGTGYRESELSAGVVVSKAPSTVTIEAGTYKFVNNPTSPNADLQETAIENVKGYYLTANNVYATETKDVYQIDAQTTDTGRASLTIYIDVTAGATTYNLFDGETEHPSWYTNDFTATDTTKLKILVVEQNIEVSPEFYKWAITDGNLVKQAGYKLTLQLLAFQQDQDPSNAYIKINSDTVSSTDYDYMIQGSPSSIFDKNGVRVDASSALVITGVYKVAWRGAYSAYLIGEDTPQIVGSQYTLSTYELSGDTTLQIRYEYSGSLSSPANTEEPTI